jgi:peptidyl-prolyl cis-trans isomerase D
MSVIQRIRDKGAWIITSLIALALIAFILQDRGTSGGSFFSDNKTIGKIYGTKVDAQEFREKVNMYIKRGATEDRAAEELWNQEVMKAILLHETDKLGLVCSQKEASENLFSPSSQFMQQYFRNPQTGEFDYERARQAVNQIKKSKNTEEKRSLYEGFIEPIELQTLQLKYQALIDHSVYIPKWMVEKQLADNNAVASASFVYVPYSSVTDSTVKVSDDEITTYAKKHEKEYSKENETRTIGYITFDAFATSADSTEVRNQLEKIKADFAASTDAKAFLSKNGSNMDFYNGYVAKKEIKVAVKDTLFKQPVGGTFGPYVDGNNFVIAKVVGATSIPDTVKVRHILIATQQQDQQTRALQRVREDSTAKRIADSVALAIKNGANFDSLLAKYSDDGGSKDKGGVYEIAANAGMVPEFSDFGFTGKTGDKSVVKTDFGYHYMEILSQKGSEVGYKIAYLGKPIIISDKTISDASSAAAQFWSTSKSYKDFNANAIKLGKAVLPATDIKENDFNVQGLGSARKLVYWTYKNDVGDITNEAIKIGDKYVVAVITSVNKPGLPAVATLRPMVEFLVRNEKKAKQIIATKFKGNTLESYASAAGTTVQKADSILFTVPYVPGVGNETKFVGAAFNASIKGKATEPIAGYQGVFALRVENIAAKTDDSNNAEMIKQRLLQMQKNSTQSFMEALKKDADIKDNRGKIFTE